MFWPSCWRGLCRRSIRSPSRARREIFTRLVLVGSFQWELGCPYGWDSRCEATRLDHDPTGDVWRDTWELPPGTYDYRVTLEGLAIPLVVRNSTQVTFCYDGKTHWVTDDLNLPIVTLPGSCQVALGCGSVWDPSCMRSWRHDPDGDVMHGFLTRTSPPAFLPPSASLSARQSPA